jgi:hypothetical protein
MFQNNNQPHVVVFSDPDEDFSQYFVAIEQMLTMQAQNLVSANFFMLAAHYIFNMDYHPKLKDLMAFFQIKVAGLEDDQYKWGAVVGTHVGGLCRQYALLDHGNSSDEE